MTVTAAISGTLPQAPGFSPNPAAIDAVVDVPIFVQNHTRGSVLSVWLVISSQCGASSCRISSCTR